MRGFFTQLEVLWSDWYIIDSWRSTNKWNLIRNSRTYCYYRTYKFSYKSILLELHHLKFLLSGLHRRINARNWFGYFDQQISEIWLETRGPTVTIVRINEDTLKTSFLFFLRLRINYLVMERRLSCCVHNWNL
jgi:hypothetical protein